MRKLAILIKLLGAEINVALRLISVALFDKGGNNILNSVDIFGSLGMNGSLTDTKALGIGPELLNISFGYLLYGDSLFVSLFYKLIVDIGKVLNEVYVISAPLEIAAKHVENAKRTGVTDMNIVINGRSAGINFKLSFLYGNKLLLLSC